MKKNHSDSIMSVRLPTKDAARLQREARLRGMTVSRLVREAIAAGLSPSRGASLSYGVSSGGPLSIFMVGIGLPEIRTTGGLALELA